MRPQKIDDQTLLSSLIPVLSLKGYDGASLNDFASSSGLQKASLYHRFPGGKKEIALAVLQFVGNWTEHNIVRTLNDQGKSTTERLNIVLEKINELYKDGKATCILRALSMDSGMELFNYELEKAAKDWIDSFYCLAKDFGIPEEQAYQIALKVLTTIQGSLVVSKMLHNNQIFKNALLEIHAMYIKK
jgi:AcrR family transcriptional regulator